ncbi:hypothetical protein OBK27_13550 [Empedobacter falsenii]
MSTLNFNPWIGENYHYSKQKVLIIGDSHYWPYKGHPIVYNKNFTRNIIGDDVSLNAKFFRNTAKLFGKQNFEDIRDDIAFANAIQDFFENPNDKPTKEQLDKTENSIKEYIKLTQPNKVIILSFRIWEYLFNKKKDWGNYKQHIIGHDKKTTIWELYPSSQHGCLAIGLYHPSSPGWKLEDWKPVLKEFLETL